MHGHLVHIISINFKTQGMLTQIFGGDEHITS